MSQIKVILKQDIKSLGNKNEIITVKEGYARNYLFANNLAIQYTDSTAGTLKNELSNNKSKINRLVEEAKDKKKLLESKKVILKVKSNEGKIFGSVSHQDLADAIKAELGLEIDKKKIVSDLIKSLGNHVVKIKLYHDVEANVNVEVI